VVKQNKFILQRKIAMTLLEQIEQQLKQLPPEKQSEVLDFVTFLRERAASGRPTHGRSLRQHSAFGSWRGRNMDALEYQQKLRAEWDSADWEGIRAPYQLS
jgi:hypothetical protein